MIIWRISAVGAAEMATFALLSIISFSSGVIRGVSAGTYGGPR